MDASGGVFLFLRGDLTERTGGDAGRIKTLSRG